MPPIATVSGHVVRCLLLLTDTKRSLTKAVFGVADRSDLRMTQILKHAEMVRIDSIAAAIDMVHAGKVDA